MINCITNELRANDEIQTATKIKTMDNKELKISV